LAKKGKVKDEKLANKEEELRETMTSNMRKEAELKK